MKLVRFCAEEGQPVRLGVWTDAGILDVSACARKYARYAGEQGGLSLPESPLGLIRDAAALDTVRDFVERAAADPEARTTLFDAPKVRLLAPVPRPTKIICIGLNYRDHCIEHGNPIPTSPVVFSKFPTAVLDPGAPIVRPRVTEKMDYEAELGVVISRGGHHVSQEEALAHVGGYLNFNDVTARDLQKLDGQWIRAKSCDTFAPMGPLLTTADEIPDPQNLGIACRVNGQVVQNSNTVQMIFTVAYLVSFLSEFMTLEPGDVIATGTPPGVGNARKPPVYLKAGDVVEVEVEGLGVLSNPVVDEE
jgi:2-keto-4-pentenoate hydratase/2-oxohepta-3-ene-1,7-dioic acid hydratase in catechol pathway